MKSDKEKRFKEILSKYVNNTLSDKENHIILDFYEKMQRNGLDKEEVKKDLNLRNRILNRIIQKQRKKFRKINFIRTAALFLSVIFIASLFFLYNSSDGHKLTAVAEKGQKTMVTLSDSSRVYLNAESELTYPKKFKGPAREVSLKEEAFFDVFHDPKHPFIVHGGAVQTRVLGTSFNVKNYIGEAPAVTVHRGAVQVSSEKLPKRSVNLHRNEQAVLTSDQKLIKRKINSEDFIAWRTGEIRFQQADLAQVIRVLNRRFDVNIIPKPPIYKDCTITGIYPGHHLEDILQSLKFIYGITYQFEQNHGIRLTMPPCAADKSG